MGAIGLAFFPHIVEAIVGHLVTMPIYFLIILLSLGQYTAFLIFPLVYIIYTYLVSRSDRFGKITFISIFVVVVLNTLFILQSFDYGLKYWGKLHTVVIIAINLLTSIFSLSLSYTGWKKNLVNMQYAANLILFFMLSWSAFPYLGEV